MHVPYRGEQPALADVMGNQVGVLFANIPAAMPYVQAGKLKALATTGEACSPLAPDVPTIAEVRRNRYRDRDLEWALRPRRQGAGSGAENIHRCHREVLGQGAVRERLLASGSDRC